LQTDVRHRKVSRRGALGVLAVVIGFGLVGVIAAVGWHAWWAPAPKAVVYKKNPYFMPDGEFRSTGTYVAIALPVGLVLGLVLTWWRRREPLKMVLALLLGSVVAGGVMLGVGMLLGPADPQVAAQHAADMASVPAMLRVQRGAAWCVFPFGAMLGALIVLLATAPDPADTAAG
jgi:hypothetical protein